MKPKTNSRPRVVKVTAAPDYAVINAALENHLDLTWTEKNQNLIKRKVSAENFLKVQEVIAFTSNQDAWLNDSSVSSAADKVSGKLSQHYPSLTPGAIFKIVNQATYGWR